MATAIEASKRGAHLALVGRDSSRLDEALTRLSGEGHVSVPFDLDGISSLVGGVAERLGGIDVLVSAAGGHAVGSVKRARPAEISAALAVDVSAAALLAGAFASKRVPKQRTSIVFVASAVGLVGQAGLAVYSEAKGAVITLSKSLALELARDGIRVNCVCPGIVETDLVDGLRGQIGESAFEAIRDAHPLGLGTPYDVAGAILYLASDEARWVTGSSLVIDGGYTAR